MHFICLLKPPALMICERWRECLAQTPALTACQHCLLEYLQTQRMYFPTFSTLFYLEVWKIMYSNQCVSGANISCNFFFYCIFAWFCNLGVGSCTDESLFPVLFSVMVHQNYCQHNVRLELQWAFTFLCFVTVDWCVSDIRIRKKVCGCFHLL
jgi:hypothetical protein